MTPSRQADCEMRTRMPASMDAIEEFFRDLRGNHSRLLDHADSFAVELLIREALTNAVVHGCRTDPARQVRCILRLKLGRLLIAIEDDGAGFDWRAARRHAAALSDCSGRGTGILQSYASHVRYNNRGNLVAIAKRLR